MEVVSQWKNIFVSKICRDYEDSMETWYLLWRLYGKINMGIDLSRVA